MSARIPGDADLLAAVLEGQARIEAKLDRVLDAIEAGRTPAPVHNAMAAFVHAAHGALQHLVFTSAELAAHAEMPEAAELRGAILGAVGTLQPRRIGKALQALEGRDVEGLSVHRVAVGRDGANWMIATVRE